MILNIWFDPKGWKVTYLNNIKNVILHFQCNFTYLIFYISLIN